MSEQLTLLSEPRARHDNPATSHAAAERVKPGHSRRLETVALVIELSAHRGCTAEEVWLWAQVQAGVTLKESTWRGAVSRASAAGFIVPNGQRRDGMTVYVAPQYKEN